jgi:hypothetical protein
MAATDGSDALAALVQLAAVMATTLPQARSSRGDQRPGRKRCHGGLAEPSGVGLRINFPGPALGWSVVWTATRYGEKLPVCDGSDGNLAWSLLAAQLTVLTILTFLA